MLLESDHLCEQDLVHIDLFRNLRGEQRLNKNKDSLAFLLNPRNRCMDSTTSSICFALDSLLALLRVLRNEGDELVLHVDTRSFSTGFTIPDNNLNATISRMRRSISGILHEQQSTNLSMKTPLTTM